MAKIVPKPKIKKVYKGSNGHRPGVRLFVPRKNPKFKDLEKAGLLIPGKIEAENAVFPLDFTSQSSKPVGDQLNFWTALHSHAIFEASNAQADLGNLKWDLKHAEAAFRRSNQGLFKDKWRLEDEMITDKEIMSLRRRYAATEARLVRFNGIAEVYRNYRENASREISRRKDERGQVD